MDREQTAEVTPELLLKAYSVGVFPMADNADAEELFWVEPEWRGVLPLDEFHLPKSLARTIRRGRFETRFDTDFPGVINGCAGGGPSRPKTWINEPIRRLYGRLFEMKVCHTVESWEGSELVGGLYGIVLGGVFFGESMFSHRTDASKVAFAALVERLEKGGFAFIDTQFVTEHLERFGVRAVHREKYDLMLTEALSIPAEF